MHASGLDKLLEDEEPESKGVQLFPWTSSMHYFLKKKKKHGNTTLFVPWTNVYNIGAMNMIIYHLLFILIIIIIIIIDHYHFHHHHHYHYHYHYYHHYHHYHYYSSRRMAGHHYLFMSTEAAKFEYECSLNGLE